MATRRIKDITNTATTFASDDFIALDGATQGTRKMDKDDLIAEVSAGVSGDYLEEANNLSDVASLDTSKLNMEIPDVGTAPDEVPLNGMLGDMAYQSSEGISVAKAEVESTTGTATTQALTVTDGTDTNFVVQEDGKVGIGGNPSTTNPLRVSSSDATTPQALIQSNTSTGDAALSFNVSGRTFSLGIDKSDSEKFKISRSSELGNTDYVTIDGGKVGIGTDSPSAGAVGGRVVHVQSTGETASVRVDRTDAAVSGTLSITCGSSTNGLYSTGTKALGLSTNGTQRWLIDGSNGNLISQGGSAIDFGSTTTGTGTVTGGLLNDYEFGDFTVTAGGTWTVTPTSMGGRYVKVGNLVTCWVTFGGSPSKTSATSGWLEGLPFATNVYPGQGSVSDTSVVDRGNCYAANVNRLWLTGTSFGVNSYATVTYRHD